MAPQGRARGRDESHQALAPGVRRPASGVRRPAERWVDEVFGDQFEKQLPTPRGRT